MATEQFMPASLNFNSSQHIQQSNWCGRCQRYVEYDHSHYGAYDSFSQLDLNRIANALERIADALNREGQ